MIIVPYELTRRSITYRLKTSMPDFRYEPIDVIRPFTAVFRFIRIRRFHSEAA